MGHVSLSKFPLFHHQNFLGPLLHHFANKEQNPSVSRLALLLPRVLGVFGLYTFEIGQSCFMQLRCWPGESWEFSRGYLEERFPFPPGAKHVRRNPITLVDKSHLGGEECGVSRSEHSHDGTLLGSTWTAHALGTSSSESCLNSRLQFFGRNAYLAPEQWWSRFSTCCPPLNNEITNMMFSVHKQIQHDKVSWL